MKNQRFSVLLRHLIDVCKAESPHSVFSGKKALAECLVVLGLSIYALREKAVGVKKKTLHGTSVSGSFFNYGQMWSQKF